ncbi:MAG: HAMP domain-containing histidine kinase [Balneolaceae bacterium]|nr:HAMP domain-containing histidine kinase [Balneolaceae bacterium]
MSIYTKFKKSNTLRWFFLSVGILAVVAITGMNVYSLYALKESTIEAAKENRKIQLEEYANTVLYRFYQPFHGFRKLEMNALEATWNTSGTFPVQFNEVLTEAISDSLFSDIYFSPGHLNGCYMYDLPIYNFDHNSGIFLVSAEVPKVVCDGFGLSKSRVNTIDLEEFRWNNKVVFDAHRTMTLVLINKDKHMVVGHLNFVIDRDYLLYNILEPELIAKFGEDSDSGMAVWLRDWMQDEVLLSSNPNYTHSRDKIDMRQRFPDLLDNWVLQATFFESPAIAATNASLTRNLIALGIAVFILFSAFVFMFINAQRERELAQRQAGFLANVTHELKTPLAVMQAAGENISDGRVTDGQRLKDYGGHIYSEAIRLRKMIDKLLDVAKADSGQTLVNQAPHKLDELTQDYFNATKQYVTGKGFSYTYHSDENLPLVMVDTDHIETILSNLVENSLKYSSKTKEIAINIFSKKKTVSFSITDKGDGIPKKAQKNIFDKFYRVESSMTSNTKGHGLGLSIVKNMVDLNGGSISVSSEVDKGTTFTVTFPALFEIPEGYENRSQKKPAGIKTNIELEQYAG